MKDNTQSKKQDCHTACEEKFIKCAQKSYTGCVEVLRVCKERCGVE